MLATDVLKPKQRVNIIECKELRRKSQTKNERENAWGKNEEEVKEERSGMKNEKSRGFSENRQKNRKVNKK